MVFNILQIILQVTAILLNIHSVAQAILGYVEINGDSNDVTLLQRGNPR